MITKERLEELIEQGTQVWKIYKDTCQGAYQVPAGLFGIGFSSQVDETTPFNELFETKEEAEWHKEFGCIERTERLELPTWKEAIDMDKFIICEFDWYRLLMCPADNIGDNGWIGIDSGGNCEIYHWDNANKENYLKACQKCKELFLGERE